MILENLKFNVRVTRLLINVNKTSETQEYLSFAHICSKQFAFCFVLFC